MNGHFLFTNTYLSVSIECFIILRVMHNFLIYLQVWQQFTHSRLGIKLYFFEKTLCSFLAYSSPLVYETFQLHDVILQKSGTTKSHYQKYKITTTGILTTGYRYPNSGHRHPNCGHRQRAHPARCWVGKFVRLHFSYISLYVFCQWVSIYSLLTLFLYILTRFSFLRESSLSCIILIKSFFSVWSWCKADPVSLGLGISL